MASTSSPIYDLSGLFQIQQNYLTGLKTQSNDPDLTNKVSALQTQLQSLNTSFVAADQSSAQILDHQKAMANIVETEKARLLLKKQNIDSALDGRKRAIQLNDSYRQRYAEYTKMIIVIVFTFLAIAALMILGQYLPFIPSIFIDLLMVIIVAIGGFNCYFIYLNIANRSKMNFNEIDLDGPTVLTPEQLQKKRKAAGEAGNLLGTIDILGCVGEKCCSTGTVWEVDKCVQDKGTDKGTGKGTDKGTDTTVITSPVVNGFTTMFASYRIGESAASNSPNEYVKYAKV